MAGKTAIAQKRRRGPVPTGKGVMLGVRVQPPQLSALDAWIAAQPDPKPTRPAAIRRLIDAGLEANSLRAGAGRRSVELEDRIAEVKGRLAVPDVAKRASPEKGMEMLRRGHAENELRTLRQRRTFTKLRKKPKR
jgi:hypothetical protein